MCREEQGTMITLVLALMAEYGPYAYSCIQQHLTVGWTDACGEWHEKDPHLWVPLRFR